MTPFDVVAPVTDETLEGLSCVRRRSTTPASRCTGTSRVTGITSDLVSCETEFGEAIELEADAVVLVTQRLSDDALYHALRADPLLADEGIEAVYRIGDCVAPRMIAECIFDGHRLGREIDSAHPAVPLPYKRERMLVTGREIPLTAGDEPERQPSASSASLTSLSASSLCSRRTAV